MWALPHDGQGAGGGESSCRAAYSWELVTLSGLGLILSTTMQVAEEFGDDISILTIDTDHNRELSTSLQVGTLPVTVIEALNASVHSSWALGADTRASHFDLHWQGQVQASIAD